MHPYHSLPKVQRTRSSLTTSKTRFTYKIAKKPDFKGTAFPLLHTMHSPDMSRLVHRVRQLLKMAPRNSSPRKTRCTHSSITNLHPGCPNMQLSPVIASQSGPPAQEVQSPCLPMESRQSTENVPDGGWHHHTNEIYGLSPRPQMMVERWLSQIERHTNMRPMQRASILEEYTGPHTEVARSEGSPRLLSPAPIEYNYEANGISIRIVHVDMPDGIATNYTPGSFYVESMFGDTLKEVREVLDREIDRRRLSEIREQMRRQRQAKGRL